MELAVVKADCPNRENFKMVYQHRFLNSLLIAIIASLSLYLIIRALLNFAAQSALPDVVLGLVLLAACVLFYKIAQQGDGKSQAAADPVLNQSEELIPPSVHSAPSGEERRLREIEDVYRRAIAAADCVLYRKDEQDWTYTFVGEGILALTGYTAQEMTPDLWANISKIDIFHGELTGLTFEEAVALVKSGEVDAWTEDCLIITRARRGTLDC